MSTKGAFAKLVLDVATYFIQTVKIVTVNKEDYLRLEEETQDIEKKIREHIKVLV